MFDIPLTLQNYRFPHSSCQHPLPCTGSVFRQAAYFHPAMIHGISKHLKKQFVRVALQKAPTHHRVANDRLISF